jgi:hypothetical protein
MNTVLPVSPLRQFLRRIIQRLIILFCARARFDAVSEPRSSCRHCLIVAQLLPQPDSLADTEWCFRGRGWPHCTDTSEPDASCGATACNMVTQDLGQSEVQTRNW